MKRRKSQRKQEGKKVVQVFNDQSVLGNRKRAIYFFIYDRQADPASLSKGYTLIKGLQTVPADVVVVLGNDRRMVDGDARPCAAYARETKRKRRPKRIL